MRPVKLVMAGFGPYKDEQVIDFTLFNSSYPILFTGNTGSGKTYIFDAISYALYNETSCSEQDRSTHSLRSDYCNSSDKTYVSFTFIHKDILYNITRNPEYLRKSIKGDKLVKESSSVLLTEYLDLDIDTVVKQISSIKDVQVFIHNLIGLTKKQFSQTVMIAQNDFRQILTCSSEKRKELFQKLFNTSIFSRFLDKLKSLNENLSKERDEITSYLRKVTKNTKYESITSNALLSFNLDELINILESDYLEIKSECDFIKDAKDKQNKLLEELVTKITLSSSYNSNVEELTLVNKSLLDLKQNEESINNKRIIYDKYLHAKTVKTYDDKYKTIVNRINELSNDLNSKKEEVANLNSTKQKLLDSFLDVEVKYNNIDKLQKLSELCKKVLANNEMLVSLIKKQTLEEEKFATTFDEYKLSELKYIKARDAYYSNILLEIKHKLKVGETCPICGSTINQVLDTQDFDNITFDQVLMLEEKKNESKSKLDKLESSIISIKESSNSLAKEKDELITLINSLALSLNIEYSDFATLQTKLDKEIKDIKSLYNELNSEMLKTTSRLETLCEYIDENNALLKTLKQKEAKDLAEFEEKLHNFFSNSDEFRKSLLDDEAALSIHNEVNKYDLELTSYSTKRSSLIESLNTLSNKLNIKNSFEDFILLDISKERDYKEAIILELARLDEEYVNKSSSLLITNDLLTTVKTNNGLLKKNYEEYKIISNLYKVTSGKLENHAKVSFESYVQSYYFKLVIKYANIRLSELTNNMFSLRIKTDNLKLQGQSGLDLEVLDKNTSKWREANTLSGGESFMASLSLALGLSDVVCGKNFGVTLDAMFIDEGFGTLDDETLISALNVINKLSSNNRLIGIISHVNELKNSIDQKVIVEKTELGSKISVKC